MSLSLFLFSTSLHIKSYVCRPPLFFNPGQKGKTQKPKKHRIQWADSQKTAGCKLRFDDIPFQIFGVKILECQNGPDRNRALKRKEANKEMREDVSISYNPGEGTWASGISGDLSQKGYLRTGHYLCKDGGGGGGGIFFHPPPVISNVVEREPLPSVQRDPCFKLVLIIFLFERHLLAKNTISSRSINMHVPTFRIPILQSQTITTSNK